MTHHHSSSSPPTSCTRVPVGFRFHPTDEELVGYYLPKKVAAKHIDLELIKELDLYKVEPWDLQGTYMQNAQTTSPLNMHDVNSFLISMYAVEHYPLVEELTVCTCMP